MRTRLASFISVVALLFASGLSSAQADDAGPPAVSDDWTFAFAPYIWAAGLKGEVATLPGLPPTEVDASFSDILENFDIGFMGVGEIRKGRWAFFSDLVYVDLSADAATPGPFFSNVSIDAKTFIGTFAASYRAVATPNIHLDLQAGARVWSVETKLALGAGLLAARQREDSETWADPIIGLRARVELGSSFYLTGWGNIGGFGAASDLTWDVLGGIGYQWNDWLASVVGYRHLSVDYENDGFLFDVEQSGPVIGAVFRF